MADKALRVLLFVGFLATSFAFDSCTVMSNGFQPDVTHETANSSCTDGSVWWNYPQGVHQVTFNSTMYHQFMFCVHLAMGVPCTHIYEITSGSHIEITTKDQNIDMCVLSHDGQVVIQFNAPEVLTYMNLYDYKIRAEIV